MWMRIAHTFFTVTVVIVFLQGRKINVVHDVFQATHEFCPVSLSRPREDSTGPDGGCNENTRIMTTTYSFEAIWVTVSDIKQSGIRSRLRTIEGVRNVCRSNSEL
jgi:hypothetical protein